MARLRLSTHIAGPIEEVYQHVTAYGKDGPLSDDTFLEKYGTVIERKGDTILFEEDVRAYPEDEPDLVSWRCTFDYPVSRTMEAIDTSWADRSDSFRSLPDGTRWDVQWQTGVGGIRGIIQYLFFLLVGHRRMRREMLDPVRAHFEPEEAAE